VSSENGGQMQEGSTLRGEIAIIGMACIFPGAADLDAYWQNITSKHDAVCDPPPDSWDPKLFYDPDSRANDRVYCKRGGYLGDLARFNPMEHGIMPVTVDGGEPDQWLALHVAHAALADAGYADRPKECARTEVILGKGTYVNRGNMTVGYHGLIIEQMLQILRSLHPEYSDADLIAIKQELKASLPPFSADTAPALIGNILAGRIANRLDLMGPSFTVDGACASALLATEIGVRNLLGHKCDLALVGGVHVNTPVPVFGLFCQLGALSRREKIRPFDKDADGTILGEGLGMVVLKRREDAERDEDRIYALIKGIGTSSDGRALHVMAPRMEGEVLALRRAYEMAGVSPGSVGLVEAHGTATPVGDVVEIQSLRQVFGERNGSHPRCALGSVKSMIGHTMPAAGVASLIKAAMALHHKILPATINCDEPNAKLELEKTPFYINNETRPWVHGRMDAPRRAGVNSFGFGGINAHVVLQEYVGPRPHPRARNHMVRWETEVVILEATSREGLIERAGRLLSYLERAPETHLRDVAYTLNSDLKGAPYRLGVVASSVSDLGGKLRHAVDRLGSPRCRQIKDVTGIYFFEEPIGQQGKLAFLFPGEGSQYTNMLLDLSLHFPEVRACFDLADRAFIDHPRNYLPSDFIFPRPSFSETERSELEQRLWRIDGAVEAVLIANWAMSTVLSRLSIRPDALLGHSTGDYSAMFASGIIDVNDEPAYIQTIVNWNSMHGRVSGEVTIPEAGLVAVATDHATLASIIDGVEGEIHVAMDNCPHQAVIVGTKAAAEQAVEQLRSRGVIYEYLPFDRPYHTPLFEAYAQTSCRRFFEGLSISPPKVPVYSCTTASLFPSDLAEIREVFVSHWMRPVRFRETIEKMYADGVRVFVEVGPRGNLTAFVDDILRGAPHFAVPSNVPRRSGITQLNHLCAQLAAQRIPMRLDYLYARRSPRRLSWEAEGAADPKPAASMKLILGVPQMRVAPRKRAPERPAVPAPEARGPRERQPAETPARYSPPAPPVAVAAPRAARAPAAVMESYVATMDRFLGLQQELMQAFLSGASARAAGVISSVGNGNPRAERSATDPPSRSFGGSAEVRRSEAEARPAARSNGFPQYPLLGTVTSLVPGRELSSVRRLDEQEDIFLREHSLGSGVSLTDDTLRPISIVPLTISMEMLAEAAAALMPGRTLVGMKEVRAHRWIRVDEEPVTLSIEARRGSSAADEVEVLIRNAGASEGAQDPVVIQGIMVFGDGYPGRPPTVPFSLDSERVSRLVSAKLYEGGLMFHGPCFQGVASVDRSGKDGLVGQLAVLPPDGLFQSTASPRFVTDPVVLDAAGQLVGYWAAEYLERGFVVFPYRLEALHIYGPNRPTGEKLTCRLRLQLMGTNQVRSHLDVLGADGKIWMRLIGWEDMRFDLPERFHRFWVAPRETHMSSSWRSPLARFPAGDSFECHRLEPFFETGNTIWKDLWASLVLTRSERKSYRESKEPLHRQSEWLLGRAAAKDSVRAFVKKHRGLELLPADIEIGRDERGRPVPGGPWTRQTASVPALAISVSEGIAVAVAGDLPNGFGLGIDLEHLRPVSPEFAAMAFDPEERLLLASLPESAFAEWAIRGWSAKKAVASAFGNGWLEKSSSVRLLGLDAQTGVVKLALGDELIGASPRSAGAEILAYTSRDGECVFAGAVCEAGSS
jgi:acyl transferase domain-containing protein/phosphopantetheinyl transferase